MKAMAGISKVVGSPGQRAPGASDPGFLLPAGEVIVETQMQTAERPSFSRTIESDLEGYLDAIAGATGIFREAVDAYLQKGPDGACWRHARSIAEHMRTLDDMQQRLETGVRPESTLGDLVGEMIDPLTGVGRLLKDMKRQVTGFAIESGFSGPGRRVPGYLVESMQELADEVCAAVDALVESYRPSLLWWEQPSSVDETRGVAWYEGQADRLSMQLLKKIFGDETLELKTQLSLAQFVEEIDRVADQAESIDKALRASRRVALPTTGSRDSH
jgi:hypothetical protein